MYQRCLLGLAALACLSGPAYALSAGDIAFTAYNADEDGLSFVVLADIAANTTIYFRDDEWTGAAFNTGESATSWNSGAATVAAGTVVRFSAYDVASRAASVGTLTAAISTNFGLSTTADTVYAYLGSNVNTATTFLAAITNGTFAADGSLTGTGLAEGVTALRLNTNTPSASPDFGQYTGARTGQSSFAGYTALVNNVNNWTVDTTNGDYTTTLPNVTTFSISSVPEGDGLVLAMSGLLGLAALRRRKG